MSVSLLGLQGDMRDIDLEDGAYKSYKRYMTARQKEQDGATKSMLYAQNQR